MRMYSNAHLLMTGHCIHSIYGCSSAATARVVNNDTTQAILLSNKLVMLSDVSHDESFGMQSAGPSRVLDDTSCDPT